MLWLVAVKPVWMSLLLEVRCTDHMAGELHGCVGDGMIMSANSIRPVCTLQRQESTVH